VRTKKKRLWRQRSISPSLFSILVEADDGEGKRMASPGEVQCEARGYGFGYQDAPQPCFFFFFFFFFFRALLHVLWRDLWIRICGFSA
jgi:hypothetical protein